MRSSQRTNAYEIPFPCLILAAHPDDEVIGASSLLRNGGEVTVVHATDGAPHERQLWSAQAPETRPLYKAMRKEEARRALALAGIGAERITDLGFVDQQLSHSLVALTHALRLLLERNVPRSVVVHPYEGGHPDHDACAFAARAALTLARHSGARVPRLFEMTSYHRWGGQMRTGRFLPAGVTQHVHTLSREERELKARMLACFESQAPVFAPFELREERFRPAPNYDFTEPPHTGALHYETLGWATSGAHFCALSRRALAELRLVQASEKRGDAAWA